MTAFEEMGVLPEIAKAVDEMEWNLPSDVQAEAVPLILGGGDVLMAAETGSGKTGAFCLPILQIVWESLKDELSGKIREPGKFNQNIMTQKWGMNVFDRSSDLAVSPDGMTCQSRDFKIWNGCRSTKGVSEKGKFYYEAKVTDEGLCRVGWSTSQASHDLGTDEYGFGFGGTGKKSNKKQFDTYGEPFGKNDVVGCFLNLDDWSIAFSLNGKLFGEAFKINRNLQNGVFFASCCLKNAELEFNFGNESFKYPPGSDYKSLVAAENAVDSQQAGTAPKKVSQSSSEKRPKAIIIEPSRELAEQTLDCLKKFKKHLKDPNIYELLIVGGIAAKDQIAALRQGVDIIVGTPGRLEDLISSGQLSLSQVRFFVLDEADGLLSQGHGDLINRIHKEIPKVSVDGKRLQMVICSATLHSFDVKKLAERLMHFPTWVDLKGEDSVPETVHHVVCMVDPRTDETWRSLKNHIYTDEVHVRDKMGNNPESLSEAVKILKGEYVVRAIKEQNMDQGILFCRTKIDCDNLETYLNQVGKQSRAGMFSCVCLHGDRKPHERKANLERFKKADVRFLICTDVAARGIDIKGVPYVVNVTLPDEKNNYVHRIGRVGRAERMGLAISLVSSVPEKVWYHSNCSSKGKNCSDTRLTTQGGCCIWYNEPQFLADIEDHLNCTIQQVQTDLKVPADEFDGKVTYGHKRKQFGSNYETHTTLMAPTVLELSTLETQAQSIFMQRYYGKVQTWVK